MRHGRSEQVEECFAGEDGRLAEGAGGARGVRRSSAAPWAERPPRGSEGRCGLERRRPRQVVGERMPQQGKTPGKNSRPGKEVQERIRKEGTLKAGPDGMEFNSSDGEWYPIRYADMSHKTDAVKWWNEKGREYGAKSKEVRDWMLDPDNYTLEHYSTNRSAGGRLPDRYKSPLK